MLKRLTDISIAFFMLLVLSPLLFIIASLLLLTGENKVFYFQERVGFRKRKICLTKFATMLQNSSNIGSRDITLANDPRVLPIGRVLRKTKLNELPQLWDVLTGKLSLVGWRPLMATGFSTYPLEVQQLLVQVRPGLTGIGSLVFRDEESIITKAHEGGKDVRACYREDIMPYKGALECWYVEHANFVTDIKILTATAIAVLSPSWRGYRAWFPGLPVPESELLKGMLK